MRPLLAALVLLLVATPAAATTNWVEGFESQTLLVACPGGTSSADVSTDTTAVRSGSARLKVNGLTSSSQGRCTMIAAGANLTGTIYVFGAFLFDSTTTCSGFTYSTMLDLGEVTVEHACIDGGNTGHAIRLREEAVIGSQSSFLVEDVWYPFVVKVVTGSGTATASLKIAENGTSWTEVASGTGLTIANVDKAQWLYPKTVGNHSGYTFALDDFIVLTGGSEPPPQTHVNMRAAKSGTPTYNAFTKVGGDATNINTIWTSRANLNPTTFPGSQYARSASTANLSQTALVAAWDGGTPTPVVANTATFHGCKWDVYATRGGGTNRSYAIRRRTQNGSDTMVDTDTSISPAASTYTLYNNVWDILGSSGSAKITGLNAMEFGGIKTASSSGAELHILDQWVQCAWSDAATAGVFQWMSDDE